MERHHLDITQKTLRLMELKPGERLLDLGCGSGWATRLLAPFAAVGQVVGIDISDEMVRQARSESAQFPDIEFRVGSAAQIPSDANSFDKVLSVESFYYYPDQDRALDELFRVMGRRHACSSSSISTPTINIRSSGYRPESSGARAVGGGVCRNAQRARI